MEKTVKKREIGSPNGIRTRVSALRGLRPKPLDDGAKLTRDYQAITKRIQFQKNGAYITEKMILPNL